MTDAENSSNNTKDKEDKNMAMAIKPDEATIIKKNMLSLFIKELYANKVTKEYWEECSTSRNIFSSSDIEKMKKMCNSENEE